MYDDDTTRAQLRRWVDEWAIPRVKIKVGESGSESERDLHRVAVAREVVGDAELYVDANGGYTTKQALRIGRIMADQFGVTWSKNRCLRTTWLDSIRCATALTVTWRRGGTATPSDISPACSRLERWTVSKPM